MKVESATLATPSQIKAGEQGRRAAGESHRRIIARVEDLTQGLTLKEGVPLYVLHPEIGLVYTNDGYRDLARRCARLRPSRADERAAAVPAALVRIYDEVVAHERTVTVDEEVMVGNEVRHLHSRHFPVYATDGVVVAVAGTYIDRTEFVEALAKARIAEQRFSDFARSTSDWLWETDVTGRITSLSDRVTDILGYPVALMVGQGFDEIGRFPAGEERFLDALRGEGNFAPFRDRLFFIADSRGEERRYHLSGVPVFEPRTGTFMGYRGTGTDVTAQMLAEAAAAQSRRELEAVLDELRNRNVELEIASARAEASLTSKNEFLASMSHELRTPLNAIIGFAEAIQLNVLSASKERYDEYIDHIVKAGWHLLGLIDDVLDVARVESGDLSLSIGPVSLGGIVKDALELVEMRASAGSVDLSGVALDRDYEILADPKRAVQILVNLLSNAVKFTQEGGRVWLEVSEGAGNKIEITVADTGVGIPDDKLELVFDKFTQLEESPYTRRGQGRGEGAGLGLHISRELARVMSGGITAESRLGHGSRFTLRIPRP